MTQIAATVGATLGLAASAVYMVKGHGLKISNFFKSKEYIDIFKKIEFNEKDVINLASSSIIGGFIDKRIVRTKCDVAV